MDPAAILQGLIVGAFLLALLTGSAVLFGLVRIASAGGIRHLDRYPSPGVAMRAEATGARMRARYLGRQSSVQSKPAPRRPRLSEVFLPDAPALAATEASEALAAPQEVAA